MDRVSDSRSTGWALPIVNFAGNRLRMLHHVRILAMIFSLDIGTRFRNDRSVCFAWEPDLASGSEEIFEGIVRAMVWEVANLEEAGGITICFGRAMLLMELGHFIFPAELCAVAAEDEVSPIREQMY